uniref:NADH dehydrogenase subunit 6 n=1 Tax=Mycopsylla gardenensis TaxID=2008466 RepID=A0A343SSK3_9HEMI|nr:NADH dehydrogenase subunit 6 [Mycopsylla gardenensis]
MLLMMNLIISAFMIYASYPLLMGMMLLVFTISLSLSMRMMSNSSWISSTMFLIMIGGLMIIFLYITSICGNQKFKKIKIKMPFFYMFFFLPLFFLSKNNLMKLEEITLLNTYMKEFFKIFMPMNIYSTLFILIYLILTLIIMINLMNFNSGPLRKKY